MGSGAAKSVLQKQSGNLSKSTTSDSGDLTTVAPPSSGEAVVNMDSSEVCKSDSELKDQSKPKGADVHEHDTSVSAVHELNKTGKTVEVDERTFLGRKAGRGFTVNVGRVGSALLNGRLSVGRANSLPSVSATVRSDYDIPEDLLHHLEERHRDLAADILTLQLHYVTDQELEDWRLDTEGHIFGKENNVRNPPLQGERELEHYGDVQYPMSLGYRISNVKGSKGGKDTTPNQDNFSCTRLSGEYDIVCVMDGHGKDGHLVSSRAVQTLPYFLTKSQHFPENMDKAMLEAFKRCQEDILRHSVEKSFDAQGSGCTGLATVTHGGFIWTAHCGDSRALITTLNNRRIVFETADHKPDDPAERERIEASGGEIIAKKYGPLVQHRVFVKGKDMPGLLMSRCLGDCCVKDCGVVATPDVSKVEIPTDAGARPFMIMGSDGIWEFLNSDWIAKHIAKKLSGPYEASKMDRCLRNLCEEARKSWAKEEANYCDDITCILIPLFMEKVSK